MNDLREWLLVGGGLALLAAGFAWLNGGVRVDVNLGLARVDAVPLPIVVFVAFLLGMLTLFLASLKAELRTHRMLRRYREALGRETPPRTSAGSPARPSASSTGGSTRGSADADPATDEA